MNKLGLTILEKDQIFMGRYPISGVKHLEIFKRRGTQATITDYAILLGGYVSDIYYPSNKRTLENRTGRYWTKSVDGTMCARIVNSNGVIFSSEVSNRIVGVRLALPFSSISHLCSNRVLAQDGVLEVEYGEYPGKAVSKKTQIILEELYQEELLSRTGKHYTRDSIYARDSILCKEYDQKFQAEKQEEFEYKGKRYVRVRATFSYYNGNRNTLSNEEQYEDGDYVWVEVEPIKWLVDEKNNMVVSEKLLFAGVQFQNVKNYEGDFENTDLKWFIDNYFVKEMIPSNIITFTAESTDEPSKQKVYTFNEQK